MLVAEFAEESEALFYELLRPCPIALLTERIAELLQGLGRTPRIPESAMERERLLGPKSYRRRISTGGCQLGRPVESFGARRRRTLVGEEGAVETTHALHDAPAGPEIGQSTRQPQGTLRLP